jgi:hypothetical protein
MDMNRWLYRAAGTVGIAGGVLLLGAGSAYAEEAGAGSEGLDATLDDVFSPTASLPPLDLSGDRGASGAAPLTLDPHDGRPGRSEARPEVLPALGEVPLDLLVGAPSVDGLPLDLLGLPDAVAGVGLPPLDRLLQIDGRLLRLPVAATGAPTLPAPVDTILPADDPTGWTGGPAEAAEAPEILGALPTGQLTGALPTGQLTNALPTGQLTNALPLGQLTNLLPTGQLTGGLLDGRTLGNLVTVGNLAGQVPVAGPVVTQTVRNLPLVGGVMAAAPQGPLPATAPAMADPLGAPIEVDDQVPAVIADELATAGGFSPELFKPRSPELLNGGLPLVGPALDPVTRMVGIGNLPSQLPLVGPLAGPILAGLPIVNGSAPASPMPVGPTPVGPAPAHAMVGEERPIAGDDPEFTESTEVLPVAGLTQQLPVAGLTQQLPVAGLTQRLPLPAPLSLLRSLPMVNQLAGTLPL